MRMLALLPLLLLPLPAAAQEVAEPEVSAPAVVRSAITGFIRPAFADFAEETAVLDTRIDTLCSKPQQEALEAARAQFKTAVTAWSRIELLRFGPLLVDNRVDRVLFWPDRRGIGLRQVQGILAEEDPSATTLETLRGKSVAVQGLGALEFVLFGTGSDTLTGASASFRCSYADTIGDNLTAIGAALNAEWADPDGISPRLIEPRDSDPQYRSGREVLEALVGVLAHGTEAVRDTRLLPFLGRGDEEPRAKAALFWRSGMAIPSIRANFEGLERLFERSGIGQAVAAEHLWVAEGVAFEFANVHRAADIITEPVEQALADAGQRRALDYLVILTQSLQTLLGEHLPAALGLSVGFSSLDGD